MRVHKLNVDEPSCLMEDYLHHYERLSPFFAYDYRDPKTYADRLTYLKERRFEREKLVAYLRQFNGKYHPPEKVIASLEKLRDDNAVVVVGGQQAGLLTGPSYTVNKCLSIIKWSEKLEADLGVPVVPVFWIAGEDHDFDEVNHVFIPDASGAPKKHAYRHPGAGRDSVTQLQIDHERLTQWLEEAFQSFGETQYTDTLLKKVKAKLDNAKTLIDFFAAILMEFFGEYGLVLLDSGDHALRKLESDYFAHMIEANASLAESVVGQLSALKDVGYPPALDQKPESANLFYHRGGERILLERKDPTTFVNEQKGVRLTREALLEIAKTAPEQLSNNVVTRPLMQECLLPTVAFIAGPGEVAYWSALKGAFEKMGMVMPPVVPRLRLTLVDEKILRWLGEKGLALNDVFTSDWSDIRQSWLNDQHEWEIDRIYKNVQSEVEKAVQPLYQLAKEVNPHVLPGLCAKNEDYIQSQLAFIKKAIEREITNKFTTELRRFDRVKATLYPDGQFQERTWSVIFLLNRWGPELIDRLMAFDQYPMDGEAFVVEL